jgi:hypothetical protein
MKTASQNETSFSSRVNNFVLSGDSNYKNRTFLFEVFQDLSFRWGKSSTAILQMQLLIVNSSISSRSC